MKKIFIVHWSQGELSDENCISSYGGIHGVYSSKTDAVKALVECKDGVVSDLIESVEGDTEEERDKILDLDIYGSEAEEYFEVDYSSWYGRNEIYIGITEKEI